MKNNYFALGEEQIGYTNPFKIQTGTSSIQWM
jgi:hypothetical protein